MLVLERYNADDYDLYSQLVFNEQTMNMNMGRVFNVEEASMFFQLILSCNAEHNDYGFYKVYSSYNNEREYIGMGALTLNDDYNAVEIEYMLLPQYWNKGYGTELVNLLLQKAKQMHKCVDIIAITDPMNTFSKRILERAGFELVKQYINDDGELAELYRLARASNKLQPTM
ncbi:MAG: GNAT family N-acetyltransferase [Clostridiales bacterium]|nr:GNAT family N-acetyltransferase [Clostridiales bacterium]